jgi:3-methyladenine DNA glycosylase AlkC
MITKVADIRLLLVQGRRAPDAILPRLRELAGSEAWQEREVAATGLVELAKHQPAAVLAAASEWARDRNAHVRRASSEGLRGLVQRKPSEVRAVLEELRSDPDLYVKKSVANVLRNATRTQPDFVIELCQAWARESNPHTRWIVRDGLRKMKALRPVEAARILACVAPSA